MDNYLAPSDEISLDDEQNLANSKSELNVVSPPRLNRMQRYLRRVGCLLIFVIFLICMTMPCFFVTLMVENEVVHQWSDRPGDEVRVFRLEGSDTQGFGFSWGSLEQEKDNGNYCVKTDTRYLVWEGEADSLAYCECYEQIADETWQLAYVYQSDCQTTPDFDLE